MDSRAACIALIYDHVKPEMSLSEYSERLTWWELEPITVGGDLAGALMAFRNKLHIFVKPEYRGRWFRRWMLAWLRDRIEEYGPISVTAFKDNPKAIEFFERLGFVMRAESETTVHLELWRALICQP